MQKFKKEVRSQEPEYKILSPALKNETTNYTKSTNTFLVFGGRGKNVFTF